MGTARHQMCGSANGEVSLWDVRHAAQPVRRVPLDGGRVGALAFTPHHRRRLAVATAEVRAGRAGRLPRARRSGGRAHTAALGLGAPAFTVDLCPGGRHVVARAVRAASADAGGADVARVEPRLGARSRARLLLPLRRARRWLACHVCHPLNGEDGCSIPTSKVPMYSAVLR